MRPTAFTGRMGVQHPLVLAPMAGGPSTPALCAAVSEAGGPGAFGGAYLAPGELWGANPAGPAGTSRPVAINLFADGGVAADEVPLPAGGEALARFRAELALPQAGLRAALPDVAIPPLAPLAAVLLEERVPVFSFPFGIPPREMLDACRKA